MILQKQSNEHSVIGMRHDNINLIFVFFDLNTGIVSTFFLFAPMFSPTDNTYFFKWIFTP